MSNPKHPLGKAIEPLINAVGGTLLKTEDIEHGDITLEWEGEPALGVRLDEMVSLDRMVGTVEEQLGSPLADLNRADKQKAIRMLDQRGAFRLRKSIEDIGEAMGVSRITIYNYLSAIKSDD